MDVARGFPCWDNEEMIQTPLGAVMAGEMGGSSAGLEDVLMALEWVEKGEPSKAMELCNHLMVKRSTGRLQDLYVEWAALNIGTVAARNAGEWQMRTRFERAAAKPDLYEKELLSRHPGLTKRIVDLMSRYLENSFGPQHAEALDLTNQGAEMAMKGKGDEAGILFRRAVEKDPECELAQFNMGVYANSVGDVLLAMFCMEKVLKINPTNEQARRAIRMLGNRERA
jgi:tetratricopeptide (TPR) repeat protein